MTGMAEQLDPVRGKARIEVLDILRGIAILGIFYMNVPFMGQNGTLLSIDPRRIGWSVADQNVWAVIQIFWEGTQRGLLEFLFGAGAMVLTAKAMEPDGPVAVADLFYRRNLWLLAFGLIDIFVLTWIGDILHVYALAALFIFPFRKLAPRVLIPLGLLWAAACAIGLPDGGAIAYHDRVAQIELAHKAETKQAAHVKPSADEQAALKKVKEREAYRNPASPLPKDIRQIADEETKARTGGVREYVPWSWSTWQLVFVTKYASFHGVLEAFCGMLLGMAFWKLGIIQGQRSRRFYAVATVVAYGIGCSLRAVGVAEFFALSGAPKIHWITDEFARLAVSFGHLALVNLLVRTRAGKAALAPFKAAGQTAFSLYFLTSILGLWVIFAPWGLGLWGRYSWAGLAGIATIVNIGLLIVANLWTRRFTNGPLEWAWRSLAYVKRQPFLRV